MRRKPRVPRPAEPNIRCPRYSAAEEWCAPTKDSADLLPQREMNAWQTLRFGRPRGNIIPHDRSGRVSDRTYWIFGSVGRKSTFGSKWLSLIGSVRLSRVVK